jgi:hypothetical protein
MTLEARLSSNQSTSTSAVGAGDGITSLFCDFNFLNIPFAHFGLSFVVCEVGVCSAAINIIFPYFPTPMNAAVLIFL